jgi:hypothetical protein
MAVKLTLQDYTVRLQLISCCLADKAAAIAYKVKLGMFCEDAIEEFKLLMITLDTLKCYTMDDSLTIEAQDLVESIPYAKILTMLDFFIGECDLCLHPAGTTYTLCNG